MKFDINIENLYFLAMLKSQTSLATITALAFTAGVVFQAYVNNYTGPEHKSISSDAGFALTDEGNVILKSKIPSLKRIYNFQEETISYQPIALGIPVSVFTKKAENMSYSEYVEFHSLRDQACEFAQGARGYKKACQDQARPDPYLGW